MRVLKKAGLIVFGLLGSLILIVILMVVTIWLQPQWVLTEGRVRDLFDQFASSYFTQGPQKIQFELRPNGFFGKHLYLDLSRFCLKEPEGCFEKVHVEASFKVVGLIQVEIQKLGPISIENESLTITPSKKSDLPEEPKEASNPKKFYRFSDHFSFQDIAIHFPKIVIEGKDPIQATLALDGNAQGLKLIANAKNNSGLKANALIDTGFSLTEASAVKATLRAQDGWRIQGDLNGKIDWTKLDTDLNGEIVITELMPRLQKLAIRNLQFSRHQTLKLNADLEAVIEPKFDFRVRRSALPKVSFVTTLKGKLDVSEAEDVYEYVMQLGPGSEHGISMLIKAEGKYPAPEALAYRYGLQKALVKIEVPVFQKLVTSLRNTSSAIPAPFSSMTGSILIQAGNDDASLGTDQLPVKLVTDLNSTEQTIKTRSEGKVLFVRKSKKMRIEGKSLIEKIRFTLPDLDILTPQPALSSDSRIVTIKKFEEQQKTAEEKLTGKTSTEKSNLDLNWKVSTAPSGIELHYPILKPFAPLQIEWEISGKESKGDITVLPFRVEFMNRKAKLEHLHYYLKPDEKIAHYEGKFVVPKTEYTIFISVFDQSGKPKVEFTSSPPLSEADIISVLLFNQTSTQLTPDESSSVGDTRAAVANRALGLFSIWALSSTPVEAVNFNPSTKVYSARVKLASGLTASIGTDWENTQEVALRKRLGRNFVLSTSVQTDRDTDTETKKTLLEWFRRF